MTQHKMSKQQITCKELQRMIRWKPQPHDQSGFRPVSWLGLFQHGLDLWPHPHQGPDPLKCWLRRGLKKITIHANLVILAAACVFYWSPGVCLEP